MLAPIISRARSGRFTPATVPGRFGRMSLLLAMAERRADRVRASVQLNEARGAQYTNIVAFLQALGRGWDAKETF